MITGTDRRRMLEGAWSMAVAEGKPLRDVLRSQEDAAAAIHASGSIQSVSNGALSTVYWTGAAAHAVTSAEIARAWGSLVELYDDLAAANPSESEEERYRKMLVLARLSRKSYLIDAQNARFT